MQKHLSDPSYLRIQQYSNGTNLSARIQIHERFSTNTYGWYPWLFEQIDPPSPCQILEIGCGTGSFWPSSAQRVPPGWNVTLSDFSYGMLRDARQRLIGSPAFRKFGVSDAQALPYPAASFDTVIANHMLYHVPNRARALAEISRVLKPGGKLYAATNGASHLKEIPELVAQFDPALSYGRIELSFSLENGAEQLAPWFSAVEVRLYDDSLRVTEAEPLLAYILSMAANADLNPARTAELNDFLAVRIAQHGAIHISKAPCLFIAQK